MRFLVSGVFAALLVFAGGLTARAQVFSPGDCRSAPQPAAGFVPLPDGELFCPFLADPKAGQSFASIVHGTARDFPSTIGAVGIGDRFGVARWGPVQLSLAAAVFSQFDLGAPSYDLINADYVIGAPVAFRYRGFSARARIYHQSSHLGDEFLLNTQVERENLSFESVELILSQQLGPLRAYGGGERLIAPNPRDLGTHVLQGGAELRPGARLVRIGALGSARFVAGADVKLVEAQDWNAGLSVRTGFEVTRPDAASTPLSRWQLLFEYYDGPTPYGQFFRRELSYWGVGLHFTR